MDEKTLYPWQLKDAFTIRSQNIGKIKDTPQVPEMNINGWHVHEVLNNRGHCDIYLVQRDSQEFAVLKLYHDAMSASTPLRTCLPKDEHLLPILEAGVYEGQAYDVTPYMPEGTLDGEMLSGELIMKVVVPQLAHALSLLHHKKLLHNDVKPSNLFWAQRDKEIMLGDYDTMTRIPPPVGVPVIGTKEYMAPEILTGGLGEASEASDYCSMGLTIISLLQGTSPLHQKTDVQIRRMWMRGIPIPPQAPPQLKVLINGLIQYNPTQRLNTEGISRWMSSYHIEHIEYKQPAALPKESSLEIKPLWFDEYPVFTIGEMVEQAGKHWDLGCFLLKQKRLSLFLRQFDYTQYQLCCECEKYFDKNEGLFALLHTLLKTEDFYWHGEHFENLEAFATHYLETDDASVAAKGAHFIRANMLGVYLRNINASQEMMDLSEKLAHVARQYPELAMTQLLTTMSSMPELKWKGQVFTSLGELVDWLVKSKENLDDCVQELYTSKRFEAWLTFINQGTFLYDVQSAMKGIAL